MGSGFFRRHAGPGALVHGRQATDPAAPGGRSQSAEGASFSLREFHDWLWQNGNVPFSLLRYERFGDRSELDRVDELLARRSGT